MIQMLTKALARPWPLPWRTLSAKLAGVNGFTGRGAVSFQSGGARKLSIALQGIAGKQAEVIADDEPAGTVMVVKGRANATFTSKRGDKLPELGDGSRIDIRQNGDVILSGVLSRN